MNNKKVLSCALVAVMAMQGGDVVFATEKESQNVCLNLQNEVANNMISSGYLEIKGGKVFITPKYKAYIAESLLNSDDKCVTFEDDTIIFRSNKNAMGETKIQWTT